MTRSCGPDAVAVQNAAEARQSDVAAVERGAGWNDLMDRAALGLARTVVGEAGHGYGLRVLIVAGHGNNGGDGWGAALHLRRLGAMAWVIAVTGVDRDLSEEAAGFRDRWRRSGGRTSDGLAELSAGLEWADIVIDAMLGTGATGQPRGTVAEVCRRLSDRNARVVACDIPTGVDADTGSAAPDAIRAVATATFGALKRGLLLPPGRGLAGRVTTIGLGPQWRARSSWHALTACGARPEPYAQDVDKRARGVALVVAGAVGTSGAAALCASGAIRTGAGLVTVATPNAVREEVAAHAPAMMTRGLPVQDGCLSADAAPMIVEMLAFADVVVAGPGLGVTPGVAAVVASLRQHADRLVLDADALNVHRDDPASLGEHRGTLVLTPHDRELARIHPEGQAAVQNKASAVPALARELNATILAKGPSTMVAAPDGRVWLTPTGGPGLGSGGTGDVLTGVVGAAIAHADDVPLAVARAAWWHGLAGDITAASAAGRGTATGLLEALPSALDEALDLASADPTHPFTCR